MGEHPEDTEHFPEPNGVGPDPILTARVHAAAEMLEAIIANRKVLLDLPVEVRGRLLKAAGEVYCPDVSARKGLIKAKNREFKAKKLKRDDRVLNETGIRTLPFLGISGGYFF